LEVPSRSKHGLDRRSALKKATTFLTAAVVAPTVARADDAVANAENFKAYSIIPDASAALSPNLVAVEVSGISFLTGC
jgi:hypothetical protein